ncbi:MAG: hypothetical protein O2807_05615 [bacterium]|nr:hypothetical protein [bacterium]
MGLVITLLVLGLVSGAGAASERSLRRTDSRAAVHVNVTFLNPLGKVKGDTLDFQVLMDTHSVALDGFQVETLAVLHRDGGPPIRPLGWFEPGGGGHHRSGILRFPAGDKAGKKFPLESKGVLELRIRGIASPDERVFRWELPIR